MAKIKCECGVTVSLNISPNKNGFYLVPEQKVDEIFEHVNGSTELDKFYNNIVDLIRCYNCGRLYIQNAIDSDSYSCYVLEFGEGFIDRIT